MLHDIDQERLDVVGGLAERILAQARVPGQADARPPTGRRRSTAPTSCSCSCGSAAWRRGCTDETIPPRFGLIGQETTGAGGLRQGAAHRARGARDRRGHARGWAPPARGCSTSRTPPAWSPRRLIDHGHRAIGLCNIPIGFQRELAEQLGVEPERVQLEHVGLNHLSWERTVLVDGDDRLPGLIDTYCRPAGRGGRPAGRADPARPRDPVVLPALLLSDADVVAKQARRRAAARR